MDTTLKMEKSGPYDTLSWKELELLSSSLQGKVNNLEANNKGLKISLKDAEDARESANITVTGVRRTNRYLEEDNMELNERVIMLEKLLETARKNNVEKDKTIEELNAHKLILEDSYESLTRELEDTTARLKELSYVDYPDLEDSSPCVEPKEAVECLDVTYPVGEDVAHGLVQDSQRNKISLLKHIVHQMVESL